VIGDEPANTDCDPDPSLYRQAKESKPPRRGRLRPELFSVCLTVKPVGEPDAGDRHVRFDERVAAWPKRPRPSSTLPSRHFAAVLKFRGYRR
jgi:hypothetical protein